MKQISAVPLLALTLDPQSSISLYQQLYDGLRSAILTGRLTAGTRLPATRMLASELGISRTTVVTALEQLQTEGYLEARVGSGTYVARVLPEELLHASKTLQQTDRQARPPRALSQRAQLLVRTSMMTTQRPERVRAFQAGLPALDEVPFDIWSRLAARYYRRPPRELLASDASSILLTSMAFIIIPVMLTFSTGKSHWSVPNAISFLLISAA